MLRNWTNIFIYQIKNSKLFTALNILGLSIGISGLIFALLYWNDEHSYNAWNPEKDNVYQVLVQLSDMPAVAENSVRLKAYLENDPNVENIVYADNWYKKDKIIYKGKKETVNKIINVESDFFSLFPFKIKSFRYYPEAFFIFPKKTTVEKQNLTKIYKKLIALPEG